MDFVQEGGKWGSERRRWVGGERGSFGQEAHDGKGMVVGMAGPLRGRLESRGGGGLTEGGLFPGPSPNRGNS